MKYDVTFTRYGFAEIEASSPEEAYAREGCYVERRADEIVPWGLG